jgi:ribosome recycling factor
MDLKQQLEEAVRLALAGLTEEERRRVLAIAQASRAQHRRNIRRWARRRKRAGQQVNQVVGGES